MVDRTIRLSDGADHTFNGQVRSGLGEDREDHSVVMEAERAKADAAMAKNLAPQAGQPAQGAARQTRHGQHASNPEQGPQSRGFLDGLRAVIRDTMRETADTVIAGGYNIPQGQGQSGVAPPQQGGMQQPQQNPAPIAGYGVPSLGELSRAAAKEAMAGLVQNQGVRPMGAATQARPNAERSAPAPQKNQTVSL